MAIVARAQVEAGKLRIADRPEFDRTLASWPAGPVVVTVARAYATRSPAQNAYYWAVVVPRCATALKQDVLVTHELLKAQFLSPTAAADGSNGTLLHGLVIGGSTQKLNKLEFGEYVEAITLWAAEHWQVVIPDPSAPDAA